MGDIIFLEQLINSLDELASKLEQAKNNHRIREFNNIKKLILKIQSQIKQELENGIK